MFGEIDMDKCEYERPRDKHNLKSAFELVVGMESRAEKPKYENTVTKWRKSGGMDLAMELILDEMSGEISDIPLVESDKRMYRIKGENRYGKGSVDRQTLARKCERRGEGFNIEVEVGGVVKAVDIPNFSDSVTT